MRSTCHEPPARLPFAGRPSAASSLLLSTTAAAWLLLLLLQLATPPLLLLPLCCLAGTKPTSVTLVLASAMLRLMVGLG